MMAGKQTNARDVTSCRDVVMGDQHNYYADLRESKAASQKIAQKLARISG
jgi:hypothetical protein